MVTTQLIPAITPNTSYQSGNAPAVVKLASLTVTWNRFKKWYDEKFFTFNETRFLHSGFLNQQGYLIQFLRSCGVNLSVYWEATNNIWVACINSEVVDYTSNYDTALLSAINKGFIVAEKP